MVDMLLQNKNLPISFGKIEANNFVNDKNCNFYSDLVTAIIDVIFFCLQLWELLILVR